jgi:hypothetical protein
MLCPRLVTATYRAKAALAISASFHVSKIYVSPTFHREVSSFFYTSPYTSLCFKVTEKETYQLHRIKYTYVFSN